MHFKYIEPSQSKFNLCKLSKNIDMFLTSSELNKSYMLFLVPAFLLKIFEFAVSIHNFFVVYLCCCVACLSSGFRFPFFLFNLINLAFRFSCFYLVLNFLYIYFIFNRFFFYSFECCVTLLDYLAILINFLLNFFHLTLIIKYCCICVVFHFVLIIFILIS